KERSRGIARRVSSLPLSGRTRRPLPMLDPPNCGDAGPVDERGHHTQTGQCACSSTGCSAWVIRYAEKHDFSVLPDHTVVDGGCTWGNKNCDRPGKHPMTKNGVKDASNEVTVIADWWNETQGLPVLAPASEACERTKPRPDLLRDSNLTAVT